MHVQVRPNVLLGAGASKSVHVADIWHGKNRHALMSEQLETPSPAKPALHAHTNEPTVLVHVEMFMARQLCVLSAHSDTSAHTNPLPV